VKRIAENYLRAASFYLFRRYAFYGAIGSNGHENRRLNFTAAKFQRATA